MGFKLPGKSIQTGTSGHSSALKMVSSPAKQKAYGGDGKTWSQAQKDSGGTLNETTKGQRAYEKEMKAKDPKWNKREDNKWKKTQNKINASVGSKKVYDTTKEITNKMVDRDGDGTKETKVKRGIGSTLTTTEKSKENANISIQNDVIKKAKSDKKEATTTEEKNTAKTTRDKAQGEKGEIRSGRDNAKTGTVVSRFLGKRKAKRNQKQIERREKKNDSPTAMYGKKK